MKIKILIFLSVLLFTVSEGLAQSYYPITWTDINGLIVNADNSLSKNTGSYWGNSGCASLNIIDGGTDGSFKLTVGPTASISYYIGFSHENKDAYSNSIDYAILFSAGSIKIYEKGVLQPGNFGTVISGDVLKISRVGGQIQYFKNTQLLKATATDQNLSLIIDVAIGAGKVPPITATFNNTAMKLSGVVTHKSENVEGAIQLTVTGGVGPYSYLWNNGSTNAMLSNLNPGKYTVEVKDATNRAASTSFEVGFKMNWTDILGITINADNSLSKNTAAGWGNSGAASKNELQPGEDGWIEIIVNNTDPDYSYFLGLSNVNVDAYQSSVNYALFYYNSKLYIYENGVVQGTDFGYTHHGDKLRVERIGNEIRYFKNLTLLKSTITNPANSLIADVAISSGRVPTVYTSFSDEALKISAAVTHKSLESLGQIQLTVSGGKVPYTYRWNNGSTEPVLSNLNAGRYIVEVKDAINEIKVDTFEVGNKISWTDVFGITVNVDNSLSKNTSAAWGNSGAASENELQQGENGWIEYVIYSNNDPDYNFFVGLSGSNTNAYHTTIDYAVYYNNDKLWIYEKGVVQGADFGFLHLGDVIRIGRVDDEIRYYKNGKLLKATAVSPAETLIADVAISSGRVPTVYSSFSKKALKVVPAITHKTSATLGQIKLVVSGGVGPYSYKWNTGSEESELTDLNPGRYTVEVKDASNKAKTHTFEVGNKINWTDGFGVAVGADYSLGINTVAGWGNSGAASKNELQPGEDGWVEYIANNADPDFNYFIGMSETNPDAFNASIEYAFYYNSSKLWVFEKGAVQGTDYGYVHIGDVLRVSRIGNQIRYFKNGVLLKSTETDATKPLIVDVSINAGRVPQAYSSFSMERLHISASIKHVTTASLGQIQLSVSGGKPPYTYLWEDKSTSGTRSSLSPGRYTVTVKDLDNKIKIKTFQIGRHVEWTNKVSISVRTDNSLTKPVVAGWGNSGAASSSKLDATTNGWLEYIVNHTDPDARYAIGLSKSNIDAHYTSIDYAFYYDNGKLSIYEKSILQVTFGFIHINDILRIGRVGNEIRYYKNGELLRSVVADLNDSLIVDLSLHNGTVPPIYYLFGEAGNSRFYTFKSKSSGNWDDYLVWSVLEGDRYRDAVAGELPSRESTVFLDINTTITLSADAECRDLHLNTNSDVIRLNTAEHTLDIYGKIRSYTGTVPGINSTSAGVLSWITTGTNGRIRLKGATNRVITENDEFSDHENLKGWTLECDLDEGVIGTINSNFRAGNVIITSGQLEVKGKNFKVSR